MVELHMDGPEFRMVRYTSPDEEELARSVARGLAPPDIDWLHLPPREATCTSRGGYCPWCSGDGYIGWRLKSLALKEPTNG